MPKPVTSQKKVIQYSNKTKNCHQSQKDGTIVKKSQNLSPVRKRCKILKQIPNFYQSEKDGTILKQCKNLSPVRKRWENTETMQKPVTSQKKMVQYSNRANPVTN